MGNTDRLIQLKQTAERARTVKAAIEHAEVYRAALEQKIKALKESLLIEDQDVADLKGVNISTLLLTIRGKLGVRKEQQEVEALAIRLKLDESEKELTEVVSRIDNLNAEQVNLSNSESEFESLYEQQKQRLIRERNENSNKIAELSEDISLIKAQLIAADEALKTGEEMLIALGNAMESLKRAEEANEIEFGHRSIGDIRYEFLDEASEYVEKSKLQFDVLKTKAAYVDALRDNATNTGFLITDMLFENLIPNWYTEGKIDRAKTRISLIKSEVFCDVLKLRQLSGDTQNALNDLETRLYALVLGAKE